MIYPKKTPAQAKQDEESKKLISQQQREQLKAMVSQKFQNKYPNKDPAAIQGKVDNFFETPQALTSEKLRELESYIAKSEKARDEAAYSERDDISVKSGISKMSGATSLAIVEKKSETKSQNGTVIDLNFRTQKPSNKTYRNEEEEWAAIYKYNQGVYKAEAELEKDRKRLEIIKLKNELDEQVGLKNRKKQAEIEEKMVDHHQVMLGIQKEERKEKKKLDLERAKTAFEKEMRDKQIKEIKAQKRQEMKEEKQLDNYIIRRIREEQLEDQKVAKKIRQEEYSNFRRILQENEEKRQIMLDERDRERKEEIRQIQEQNRLLEERERQKDAERKAKDEKIRQKLESAKDLIGKPSNEREMRQEMKVKKWTERKEREELEDEMEKQQLAVQRNMDNKNYLDRQVEEKKIRMKAEKEDRDEQAKIWQNSTQKYGEWEKQKAEARKQQMKSYADVLKGQMKEKFDEKRVTDRLFDLRATMYERKSSVAS